MADPPTLRCGSSPTTDTGCRLAAAVALFDRLLHDLKQPLNLIRVVAQDINLDSKKNRLDLASLPQSVGEIIEGVDQLAGSIDRLRHFVRPGEGERVDVPFAVADACRTALNRVRRTHSAAEIQTAWASGLPTICGDPSNLEQAVWELLDNAVRACTEAGRSVEVALEIELRDHVVVVAVGDRGSGVPAELRAKIFEPFFSTRDNGAGLGLALAAALVRQLGGRIALTATGLSGSVVEIQVPVSG